MAAAIGDKVEIVDLLCSHGAVVELCSSSGLTALHLAAQSGSLNVFRQLLQKGADLSRCSEYGITPLIMAAQGGHETVIDFILSNLTDINEPDGSGRTALMRLVQQDFGPTKGVPLLLSRKLAVDAEDHDGNTALILNVMRDYPSSSYGGEDRSKVSQYLIDAGADVEHRNHSNQSALSYAVNNRIGSQVYRLIEAGATSLNSEENAAAQELYQRHGDYLIR